MICWLAVTEAVLGTTEVNSGLLPADNLRPLGGFTLVLAPAPDARGAAKHAEQRNHNREYWYRRARAAAVANDESRERYVTELGPNLQ